jgi:hypothetical protein
MRAVVQPDQEIQPLVPHTPADIREALLKIHES